tara:strand:- start:3666 stop:4685 length:1020 start_codon:yes stop_codon:yes gene_type:complete
MKKTALITGVLGQDGAYLAEFLIKKDYKVIGISKSYKLKDKWRLIKLGIKDKIIFENLDICELKNIKKIFKKYKINEVYNFAAKSYVSKSFDKPIETVDVNIGSVIKLLEYIKKKNKKIKFYQASSSEMFGNIVGKSYKGNIIFNPKSPYAISKLFGHHITKYYRDAFNIYSVSGILFNHESPLRNKDFLIKKIIVGLLKIINKKQNIIQIGNIYTRRDWGYAKDYTKIIWKMMQKNKPKDFIIATGKSYTIKEFIDIAAKLLNLDVVWNGRGMSEKLIFRKSKKVIIKINSKFFRPSEIKNSQINKKNLEKIALVKPKTNFKKLIKLMIDDEKKELGF